MGDICHPFLCYQKGEIMIDVTRMNGSILSINNDLIETVEETTAAVIKRTTAADRAVKDLTVKAARRQAVRP